MPAWVDVAMSAGFATLCGYGAVALWWAGRGDRHWYPGRIPARLLAVATLLSAAATVLRQTTGEAWWWATFLPSLTVGIGASVLLWRHRQRVP